MPDEPMFAKLMTEPRQGALTPDATHAPAKRKILHLSVNLPEDQAEIVDRYYSMLYPTERRATRSAIIGAAIEILDRLLDGTAPPYLDASLLDAYARTRADAQERARTHAPKEEHER